MIWPWKRLSESAKRKESEATQRKNDADKLVAQSRVHTSALRREVDRNGWTELLQNAWGGRA